MTEWQPRALCWDSLICCSVCVVWGRRPCAFLLSVTRVQDVSHVVTAPFCRPCGGRPFLSPVNVYRHQPGRPGLRGVRLCFPTPPWPAGLSLTESDNSLCSRERELQDAPGPASLLWGVNVKRKQGDLLSQGVGLAPLRGCTCSPKKQHRVHGALWVPGLTATSVA